MHEWSAVAQLFLALACAVTGMACLALGMDVHWAQVSCTERAHRPMRWRIAGGSLLLLSLWWCLQADRASMATLVWLMLLALASLLTSQVLTWRPGALAWLARAG